MISRQFARHSASLRNSNGSHAQRAIGILSAVHVAIATSALSAAASEIVVTIAGPAAGPHSDRTLSMQAGAQKAALAINAKGGIKGAQVRIDVADDGCDAAKAASTAATLAAQKTDLVIGHPCDAAAIAAAKVYGASKTLFIATATRHHGFARSNSATVFRLSGRDASEGSEAAQYLAERHKGQKVAIIHDRTSASRAIADAASDALLKAGMPPPITATVIGGDKDFPVLIAKIKSAAAIFYAGYPLEAGMLFTQLRKAGSSAAFLMTSSNGTNEFTDTFRGDTAGALVMRPRFGLSDTEGTAEMRRDAADSTLAEDAVTTYAAAANTASSVNTDSVAGELAARAYTTAHGAVQFDGSGEAKRPSYDIYSWTGQNWEADSSAPLNR